ncbi:acetyl-coenzyme A synthetase [Diorhabda carinulata]|uniref:acetyl-coenzyme A synthetase n=1 Tax=Diorhabda sublineata TaxID=1163346 RepID=UPI0024E0D6E8|nr:acetyl-coenzyme A synthetase [Diorhabda sublineata]XP_057665764.1 acetyl-coenzyme A synthetase [Diorhabda carinulata]
MPSEKSVYYPDPTVTKNAFVSSLSQYKDMYQASIDNPDEFWGNIARQFHWETPIDYDKFFRYNFDITKGPIFTKWMDGATTNISYNLLDRNVRNGHGDKVAFYWEGNHPEDYSKLTYKKLLEEVCRFANVLKSKGIQKGDRVAVYMPMILEAVITMLACTRIGAIHSLVFAGFSADSFAERILDCEARVLVTADGAWRGEKLLHLKAICDQAMIKCSQKGHNVESCVVVAHLGRVTSPQGSVYNSNKTPMTPGRDVFWQDVVPQASTSCYPEWMEAEDPLFMLYTSGSTGKPKGVLHTTGGYMIYAATTFKYVFDYKPNDVYWCTADIGWITGHTYVVYGPLANAATSVLYEGTPFYPENDRFWSVVDKYKVSQFYTAPTAIRALMKFDENLVTKHDLSTLRVLGSVGEPINPEAWLWYYRFVGRGRCSIVDTFWQTETGGHVLTPLPGAIPMKPGSAAVPFFGVQPVLLDEAGKEIKGEGEGYLVFSRPWPSLMRTLFNNHDRYETTYFTKFPGYYCTGDGARRDADGYLWVTGRVDDMLNVSGHLMSTAEVESILTEHPSVAEAAVVAKPHPVKGECLYCFVTTTEGGVFNDQLVKEIKQIVREKIGPFAQPDIVQNAPALPKTRSGKIMRRILRKIALNDRDVGDISTLADSTVVEALFASRPQGV